MSFMIELKAKSRIIMALKTTSLLMAPLLFQPAALVAPLSAQTNAKPQPVPQRLYDELRKGDPIARRKAAIQMGVLRNRSSVRALMSALIDKEWRVREAVAFALGQIADPRAVEPLERVLAEDKETEVRASAAFALGMLSDPRTAEALSRALEDDEAAVRSSAIAGLGLVQDEAAVDELIALLDDSSFDVRYDAVWALGQIGEPDAVDHLRAAIAGLEQIKVEAPMREAFRQAVQNAIENIELLSGADTRAGESSRPRRARSQPETASRAGNRGPAVTKSAVALSTERALQSVVKGSVGLKVLVGNSGRAERVYVIRRLGYGLDQRAVQAVLQYRFDPGVESGLPQTTWVDIDVRF